MNRWVWVLGLLALGGIAARADAQTSPGLDIRLERDPRPGALSSALAVNVKVTVADRDTGAAPREDFEVYAFAGQAAGPRTETFPCAQEHDNSPEVPRGTYVCTVLVDRGGRWRFEGIVNRVRADRKAAPVTLGRAAAELDVDTNEVAPGVNTRRIKGRTVEVAVLWAHTAAAGAWFVAVALAAVLALPGLRRRLSVPGLHRLEDRFDLIVRSTWTAAGLLVASGTYLLLKQTAYKTPFSTARAEAVFRLPYGKPYFLTLAVKLGLYIVMAAAGAAVLREARRQLRAGVVVPAAAPRADDERAAPALARAAGVTLLAGTVGLSLSITLLKYFHELIEASRALL